MLRVLLAGGCGFIGSHLADRLLGRGDVDRLVVVDNLWTGLRSNLAHITDRRLEVVHGEIETVALEGRFDEVYHLASPASPPWYMADPVRTVSANVVGTLRLLELLVPGGLFCFTSTSEVYGDPLVTPQPESYRGSVDCTGPRSSYDEGKRCAESLLFGARRVDGTRVKVVRLFNVFGPRTRPDDGRAVSNFITQALDGRAITVYGDGSQTRSWGYSDDIVDALERYFWLDGTDFAGPLNVGNDREVSVIDVARFVQSRFPGVGIEFLPPVPQDPTNRRPDLSLINRILPGWKCGVPYEDGIDRSIEWFRATTPAMAHDDLVTVVVPAYNAAATLDETLVSVRSQSHRHLEILVVDDGSTDATRGIVMAHVDADSRVRLIAQANAGVAAARNRGIDEARGAFVAPVDADDLWAPTKVERQLDVFHRRGQATGLVYTWSLSIDADSNILGPPARYTAQGNVLRDIIRVNLPGNGSSAMVRRQVLSDIGGYDASLRARRAQGCEDIALYERVAEAHEFGLVPEPLTGYRSLPDSMSADVMQMLRSWDLVSADIRSRKPEYAPELAATRRDVGGWLMTRALQARRYADFARLGVALGSGGPSAVANVLFVWRARNLWRRTARRWSRDAAPVVPVGARFPIGRLDAAPR